MMTQLQERHRPLFTSLTSMEAAFVWSKVCERWPGDVRKWIAGHQNRAQVDDPEILFENCRGVGLDHARVVLSLANLNGAARPVIEKLIGKAIVPWGPTVEAAQEAASAAGGDPVVARGRAESGPQRVARGPSARVDNRVVVWVAENNPHRPGSEMAACFDLWRVGDTVQQCRDRGVIARSLRRDVRRGYIRVEGVAP